MPPNFDAEKACEVLLDAAFYTDEEAARRHNVTRRTVLNYRKRLARDPEFSQLFTLKLEELKSKTDWEERLPVVLREALAAMRTCFRELNPKNPQSLVAITEAVQALADVALTLRMLDARLTPEPPTAEAAADRQVLAAPHGYA